MKQRTSAFFLSAACAFVLGAAPAPLFAAPASRGTVVYFEGDVKVDGAAPEIGRELAARAVVETGVGATCEIVFGGKNAIRVGQSAVATLDFSGIVKEVALAKGGLTAVLRKLEKVAGSDVFRVDTPLAVAGVRGTSFCVWVDEASSYVCACNGTVHTIDAKGANDQTLNAAHHVARVYSKKDGVIGIAPAGVEHHSDATVESLAARIGEKLDWQRAD